MSVAEVETIPSPWHYFGETRIFGNDTKDFGVMFELTTETEDVVVHAVWTYMGQNGSGRLRVWGVVGNVRDACMWGPAAWGDPLHDGRLGFNYGVGLRVPLTSPLIVAAHSTQCLYIHCDYKSWDPLTCGVIHTWPEREGVAEQHPRGAINQHLRVATSGMVVTKSNQPFDAISALDPTASLPIMIEYTSGPSLVRTHLSNNQIITGEVGMVRYGMGSVHGFGFVVHAKQDLMLSGIRGLCVSNWQRIPSVRVWVRTPMPMADLRRTPGPSDRAHWTQVAASVVAGSDESWLTLSPPVCIEADSDAGLLIEAEREVMIYEMYKTQAGYAVGEDDALVITAGGYSVDAGGPFKEENRYFCPVWSFHGRLRYAVKGIVAQLSGSEVDDGDIMIQATSLGGEGLANFRLPLSKLSVATVSAELVSLVPNVTEALLPSGLLLKDGLAENTCLLEELTKPVGQTSALKGTE